MKPDMDKTYNYVIMDPTGNITALVENAAEISRQPFIAEKIMERHPEVEQVGFVSCSAESDAKIKGILNMAGGEFCGNASMCAAAYFAEKMADADETEIILMVSGAAEPVAVSLKKLAAGEYAAGVQMPKALGINRIQLTFEDHTDLLPLVRMQGISHLIIEEDSAFAFLKAERQTAENAVRQWAEELQAEGLGLMFLETLNGAAQTEIEPENTMSLTPLVYIPAGRTLFWEHSCASGSSAAGLWLSEQLKAPVDLTFNEPGGRLHVSGSLEEGICLFGTVKKVGDFTIIIRS